MPASERAHHPNPGPARRRTLRRALLILPLVGILALLSGPASALDAGTRSGPPPRPSKPVVEPSVGALQVAWRMSARQLRTASGRAVTGYRVRVTDTQARVTRTVRTAAGARQVTLAGLPTAGRYVARVRALSGRVAGPWSRVSAATVPASSGTARIGTASFRIAGVNVFRAAETLVMYTRTATQTVSPANEWGVEVAVRNGVISEVRDRQARLDRQGMPIPRDGYLLSGHGAARLWLLANARVGRTVVLSTATPSPTPAPTPTPTPASARVAGVYWTGWNATPSVDRLPSGYNLAYLFAAHRSTPYGAVAWGYARPQGIAAARARGMKVILSTGGAGSGISFANRTTSTNFVNSIEAINAAWGGTRAAPAFDGVDFNTFEAEAVPNTAEYLWMAQELKRRFGTRFLITSPPAPWRASDRTFCKQMLAAAAMDYCAPQYYDGPGLADPAYIANSIRTWVRDVAGGDASRIVVGFGIQPGAANYSSTAQVQQAWNQIEAEFPRIRGAFLWSHAGDAANGWGFANSVTPLVRN
ncbi:MAG: glycosyl hydrolase family 18 protein [Candidatus Nanopelagicales bacterium]|jgi:chitinase|nr:glycosyl hydrolase family 18 protein [Candidatus Nanopelagicales bacterium]